MDNLDPALNVNTVRVPDSDPALRFYGSENCIKKVKIKCVSFNFVDFVYVP